MLRYDYETVTEGRKTTVAEEKKKNRRGYHLMLFTDKKVGGVNQLGIGSTFINTLGILIVLVLITTVTGWKISSDTCRKLETEKEELSAQVTVLEDEVARITASNTELSNKVTILSNMVNTKVEEQNAIREESDAAHFPEGFPLSSSASMSPDENDPNTVIFVSNAGTSVIASGAGQVTEVIPDPDYGYCIKIDHQNGYVTEYYLSSTPLIKEGDEVLQGAILSLVESNKSKIAYKVYLDGEQIDPMDIIKIDG